MEFQPEPFEYMLRRFHLAIDHVNDIEEINLLGLHALPLFDRRHVFDFDDGIRMVVSRDCGYMQGTMVHMIAMTSIQRTLNSLIEMSVNRLDKMVKPRAVPDTPWSLMTQGTGTAHIFFEDVVLWKTG